MAINLTSGLDASDATVYTTASISPTSNALITVAVMGRSNIAIQEPTVVGNGITYTLIGSEKLSNYFQKRTVFLFRGLAASPSTGTIVITFGSTQSECNWVVDETSGVDTSGTNGSGAVVQAVTDSGDSTSLLVTLAAYGSSDNRPYATFGNGGSGGSLTITPETNWVELAEQSGGNITLHTEWRDAEDTTCTASIASSNSWAGVAIEILMVAGAADLSVDEFEAITVAEDVEGIHSDVILDDAYDAITVLEDVEAEISAKPDIDISDKFETVGLDEDVTVEVTAKPDLSVDVHDCAETITCLI